MCSGATQHPQKRLVLSALERSPGHARCLTIAVLQASEPDYRPFQLVQHSGEEVVAGLDPNESLGFP